MEYASGVRCAPEVRFPRFLPHGCFPDHGCKEKKHSAVDGLKQDHFMPKVQLNIGE